jgi:hypothetical protein
VTNDLKLDLVLGRLSDLQGQIAALTDEVIALRAERPLPRDPHPRYVGTVKHPLLGTSPIELDPELT